MKKFNKHPPTNWDYIIFCDICGNKCWYSQSYELEPETGKGGLIVCPRDKDAIDYGLIPYIIEPELVPIIVRINSAATDVPNQIVLSPEDINIWGSPLPPAPPEPIHWEDLINESWNAFSSNTWENIK